MLQQKLGAACKGVAVEQGLGGAEPGSRATYLIKQIMQNINTSYTVFVNRKYQRSGHLEEGDRA